MTRRVAIIYPWLPEYRLLFFEELKRRLAQHDVILDIYYGETPPEWKKRNDTVSSSVATQLKTRFFEIGGRNLIYKNFLPVASAKPAYDLLVLEQAIRNLETYVLLAVAGRFGRRVAFWGHGRTYTEDKSRFEEWFKFRLTNRAKWFFAYTHGGVNAVSRNGFDRERCTVVQNSTDTASLRAELADVSEEEVNAFRAKHLIGRNTALYLGGVDKSKRMDFLVECCDRIASVVTDFSLVIAGSGDEIEQLREWGVSRPWLKLVGSVFGHEKAVVLRASRCLLVPGRVGLVAVDSIVSGVPIVTTRWRLHAPEFEYLTDGYNARVVADDIDDFCLASIDLFADGSNTLNSLIDGCAKDSDLFSIESMVTNFSNGILRALASSE